jgi:hypothetical protein
MEEGRGNERFVEDELVIQTKLAFGRTTQVGPHEDLTIHVRSQHRTCPRSSVAVPPLDCTDVPLELIERLTVSITSTNASFLRYLTSLRRQDVAPVAWIVILDASSRCQAWRQWKPLSTVELYARLPAPT